MTSATRTTVQVTPQPEINTVPEAVQNHRQQKQEEEEDDELGIVKRAKEPEFTAISMQNNASSSKSSAQSESLEKYLNGGSVSE